MPSHSSHPAGTGPAAYEANAPDPGRVDAVHPVALAGHNSGDDPELALLTEDLREKVGVQLVAKLKASPQRTRKHTEKQIQKLGNSIREFGFIVPVLVDLNNRIVSGDARVEAAKLLGLVAIPTIRVDHLTEDQLRAYAIADNRLAELGEWDHEALAIELEHLIDIDFNVELTGFETPEIDLIIGGAGSTATPEEPVEAPDRGVPAISVIGDIWILGKHRLLCGDALKSTSYEALLGTDRAELVFADPPYNVPIGGHVCGLGSTQHREFAMASGEMSEAEFIRFLTVVAAHLVAFTTDGSLHFLCMDWRHLFELLTAGREVYAEVKNLCVWNKTNAGMGSLYRSQHELVVVFKNGTGKHINNVELGRYGRNRSNVWTYAGVNSLKADRREELAMHPTVKPVALVADAILDCSKRNGLVLDPFAGSGTTIIAAEQTGRRARAIELDPLYVDVAVRRWQKETGETAIHAETGLSFEETAAQRLECGDV